LRGAAPGIKIGEATNLVPEPAVNRHPDDAFSSIEHSQKLLRESIERSKELTRRSQELLDQHRSGSAPEDECSGEVA
jgi:hypothetical protein